jgi:hypothetical protein
MLQSVHIQWYWSYCMDLLPVDFYVATSCCPWRLMKMFWWHDLTDNFVRFRILVACGNSFWILYKTSICSVLYIVIYPEVLYLYGGRGPPTKPCLDPSTVKSRQDDHHRVCSEHKDENSVQFSTIRRKAFALGSSVCILECCVSGFITH